MKTPKKRLTFKTPKRTTKTAFKPKKEVSTNKEMPNKETISNSVKNKTPTQKKQIIKNDEIPNTTNLLYDLDIEIQDTEKDLIDTLKKENEYLRSANLYDKLLGLDISQVGDKYIIKYNISKNDRFIHFELMPEEDMFVYQLIKSRNLNDLGIFGDEISFEKEQISKFFYKVMEIMISD